MSCLVLFFFLLLLCTFLEIGFRCECLFPLFSFEAASLALGGAAHGAVTQKRFRRLFVAAKRLTLPCVLGVLCLDAISAANPRVIDDARARKLSNDLKRCTYYETCATYGLNVERVFQDGKCLRVFFLLMPRFFFPVNEVSVH